MTSISKSVLEMLPPLYSQEKAEDPTLYVKLAAGSRSVGYLAEGAPTGDDYLVFGLFVIGAGETWGQISISKLSEELRKQGLDIHQETSFSPTPLSSVTGFTRRRRRTNR